MDTRSAKQLRIQNERLIAENNRLHYMMAAIVGLSSERNTPALARINDAAKRALNWIDTPKGE